MEIRPLTVGTTDFALPDAIAVLERTPATLHALLAELPESWTTCNEGPETFSAFDNVGHLIHGERADWIPRARIILAQGGDRRFEPYDRFAQVRESAGKTLATLLDEFAQLRAQTKAEPAAVFANAIDFPQLRERDGARQFRHPKLAAAKCRLVGRNLCRVEIAKLTDVVHSHRALI